MDEGDNRDGNQDSRSPTSKETRTREGEERDGNEGQAEDTLTQLGEGNLLLKAKVMERSDLDKLKKPTRATWKFNKKEAARILLQEKGKLGMHQ